MTTHGQVAVSAPQFANQSTERSLLRRCASVVRMTFGVETTYIAHSNGAFIVASAVGFRAAFRSSFPNFTIETYEVVIAYAVPSTLAVPAVNVDHGHFAASRCGCAVHDDFTDNSGLPGGSDCVHGVTFGLIMAQSYHRSKVKNCEDGLQAGRKSERSEKPQKPEDREKLENRENHAGGDGKIWKTAEAGKVLLS